eukprot:m.334350 g.334350  ORF g.334350 m.334350 type:complete len:500 (+) comp17340_c0_seq1:25-1524(+)
MAPKDDAAAQAESDPKNEKKSKDEEKNSGEKKKPELTPEEAAIAGLDAAIALVRRGAAENETRFIHRALRLTVKHRKNNNVKILEAAIKKHLVADIAKPLIEYLDCIDKSGPAPMDTEKEDGPSLEAPSIELQLFMHLQVVILLIDSEKIKEAVKCSKDLIAVVRSNRTRPSTGDEIAAKCYFYFARAHELDNLSHTIRGNLHTALRTATLRADHPGQAMLLNLLLRNFLNDNLYDQAQRLVSKTVFPETSQNAVAARYLYYIGRIKAIQLDYSEARMNLELAIRKAPKSAIGFLQTANKLCITVQMLLGEIPERDVFRQPELRRSLLPYLQLTQAVRVGNLSQFNKVVTDHSEIFRRDKNYTLILRLRHNVIKTGVRMVNISYSRVSLADVATKLQLDSAEDAEYIVAKAIRDGVVDATINHQEGYVSSNETIDVYSTIAPHEAFDQRVNFCLKLHSDLVKAMRYPPNAYRRFLENGSNRKEPDAAEIAEEIEDDDFS